MDSEQRQELEWRYEMLQQQLSEEERWFLDERIKWLTKRPEEQYHEYLGRLLMQARHTPELIPQTCRSARQYLRSPRG